MNAEVKSLEIGQSIPVFELPAHDGSSVASPAWIGKWTLVHFYLRDNSESCRIALQGLAQQQAAFQELGVNLVAIGLESVDSHASFAAAAGIPFPLLSDPSASTFAAFGSIQVEPTGDGKANLALIRSSTLIDPSLRVAKMYRDITDVNHPQTVLADAKAIIDREPTRRIVNHAPVLLIPNVLPPEMRAKLIDLWEQENVESGFMRQVDGKTVGMLDPTHKIRRDHFMKPGPLLKELQTYIGNRVVPEIRKAFNYNVTRREDFRIACYDSARGGYFRPHRDNTTDGTAHRRFAMSLLLNDEYEGGALRFPEFGKHTYRPDAGSAVIFSCSLLHEALDVTAGRRFVLLSFFYGEAEAKIREENAKRAGLEYRAAT